MLILVLNATVTDLDFKPGDEITVTAMHLEENEGERVIKLNLEIFVL